MASVQLKKNQSEGLNTVNQRRIDRIERSLECVPREKGAIMLLRHGERFQVPHGMSHKNTPLTKMGKRASRVLGELFTGRVAFVNTSNMYSCVETALGISLGAGYTGKLRTNPIWGLPGVFVEDPDRAARLMAEKGVIWTYQYMARNPQTTLPGMRSCYQGSAMLVRDLHFFKIPKEKLAIYVSHDSLLACLIAGITRRPIVSTNWPAYLEGYVLWVDDWKINVASRGELLPVCGPF